MKVNNKMKSSELKSLCKEYGVKCTGTKDTLVKRLQKATFIHNICDKNFSNNSIPKFITFKHNKNIFFISINSFEKFYSFVSKKDSNEIFGKIDNRDKDFNILPLTKDDIQYCKNKNLHYSIPIILKGEEMTHRVRSVIEDEEDEDDDDLHE
jgi:hypothetical protein